LAVKGLNVNSKFGIPLLKKPCSERTGLQPIFEGCPVQLVLHSLIPRGSRKVYIPKTAEGRKFESRRFYG
jgi:hypothetical protein